MSRTDVHRPREIQLHDWFNRHRVSRFWNNDTWFLTYSLCGCNLCRGDVRAARRKSRRNARHLICTEQWDQLTTLERQGQAPYWLPTQNGKSSPRSLEVLEEL